MLQERLKLSVSFLREFPSHRSYYLPKGGRKAERERQGGRKKEKEVFNASKLSGLCVWMVGWGTTNDEIFHYPDSVFF